MGTLKNVFYDLVSEYTLDTKVMDTLWQEIVSCHSEKHRFYHTITHLENIYSKLSFVKTEVEDWKTLLFTMFYHDIIYKSSKSNNEEKSAELAKQRLTSLNYPKVKKCVYQIIATKSHKTVTDNDTNIFLDADLSVLGSSWEEYFIYYSNVRKEYSIYPDLLYKKGRRKVLKHFLAYDSIFKTAFFKEKYELQAKQNLQKELEFL